MANRLQDAINLRVQAWLVKRQVKSNWLLWARGDRDLEAKVGTLATMLDDLYEAARARAEREEGGQP